MMRKSLDDSLLLSCAVGTLHDDSVVNSLINSDSLLHFSHECIRYEEIYASMRVLRVMSYSA